MPTTSPTVSLLIGKITNGILIERVKNELEIQSERWFAISAKAYSLYLADAKKQQDLGILKKNVSATSSQEIQQLLELNEKLADYALWLYNLATIADVEQLITLAEDLPGSEPKIIEYLSKQTMHPGFRARQKRQVWNFNAI